MGSSFKSFWTFVGALSLSLGLIAQEQKREYFFAKSGSPFISGTLVLKVSETEKEVEYLVFQRCEIEGIQARQCMDVVEDPRKIPKGDWTRQFREPLENEIIKVEGDLFVVRGHSRQKIIPVDIPPICQPPSQNRKEISDILRFEDNPTTKDGEAELLEDLEWMKRQNLFPGWESLSPQERYDQMSENRDLRSMAKKSLLKAIHDEEKFSGPRGQQRAGRLIAALTALGEFGSKRDLRPAHLYWVMESMSRRVGKYKSRFSVGQRRVVSDRNPHPTIEGRYVYAYYHEPEWLEGTYGAAALGYRQYSTWNINDVNLPKILSLRPEDEKQLKMVITFIAEYEREDWEVVEADEGMDSYYSPNGTNRPDDFNEMKAPSIKNKRTGVISNVDRDRMRIGNYQ